MNGIIIHNHEFTPYWVDRLRTVQASGTPLDVLALHPIGGKDATASLSGLIDQVKTLAFQHLHEQVEALGIRLEYEMHALSWLVPRSEFATHPSWFRQNEVGDRTPDANLCPSCEEALTYLEERTALLATLLPQSGHRYFYWPDDIAGCHCHCLHCRDLTPSDQAMILVNRMLRGLRRVDPQATLCYLAYLDVIAPPTFIRPAPGIFLEYAPIRRDLTRPLSDPDCAANAAQARYILPLLDCFGRENAQVLEYWIDNSLYCHWKLPYHKFPFRPEVIQADVATYRALGFEHITSFGCFLGEDYAAEFGDAPIEDYARSLYHTKI